MIKSSKAALWIRRWKGWGSAPASATLFPATDRPCADIGLPRQLSCLRPKDKPFILRYGSKFSVFLDGDVQTKVIEYDVDLGVVLRHVTDDRGRVKLNEAKDETLTEVVRGRVEVRWKDRLEGGR